MFRILRVVLREMMDNDYIDTDLIKFVISEIINKEYSYINNEEMDEVDKKVKELVSYLKSIKRDEYKL